jgi:hypothetical protein
MPLGCGLECDVLCVPCTSGQAQQACWVVQVALCTGRILLSRLLLCPAVAQMCHACALHVRP